jgi:hypothetical protein
MAATPTTTERAELRRIVQYVWNSIGYDLMQTVEEAGEEPDNEQVIEACLDADGPLFQCHDRKQGERDNAFCKAMYAKYGFNTVVRTVAANLKLV